MKKIIIIVVAVLLLVGGAVGATLFLTGAFSEKPTEEVAGTEEGEGEDGEEGEGKPRKKMKDGEKLETFYHHLQPEFVVNFGAKSKPRFLMLEVSASTHDEKVLDVMDTHMPEIRNDLLMLFGTQNSEHLRTIEGKNELREQTSNTILKVLEKHYGDDAIEEVFFTRFVMQ